MVDRPNVLFLLSDQHSFRHLGYRNDEHGEPVRTPTLDDLATTGTFFETAYCGAPQSTPSRISALTGMTVPEHRAWDDNGHLRGDHRTIAEMFSDAGYSTALVGSLGVRGRRQFAGFDSRPYGDFSGTGGAQLDPLSTPLSRGSPYEASVSPTGGEWGHRYDPIDPNRGRPDPWQSLAGDVGETAIPESRRQEQIVAHETISLLRDWTDRDPNRPWFACASVASPHFPLTAPRRHVEHYWPEGVTSPAVDLGDAKPTHPLLSTKYDRDRESELADVPPIDLDDEAVRRARAAYFARVEYLDQVLGDLLATLERDGILEDTVVVYASTQGNLLGEHGLWWTGTWHEAATRVPMVVQLPTHRYEGASGADVSTPVSLLDLVPTVCDLCDVDGPTFVGESLAAAVQNGDEPDRGPVVCDFFDNVYGDGTEFRLVRNGSKKYVQFADAPDVAVDLDEDPFEVEEETGTGSRGLAEFAIDFDAILARRNVDREAAQAAEQEIPSGTSGNAHLLDDRRLVDADDTFYHPNVLAQDASAIFKDWPTEELDDA
ncbi:sulfatase-like hydrolase/transferase [Halomontanus rarus]|uniref:sulfatase-like hydrolase/transferase n=1 Tax=Halomontanus rarus TaxID=3034020 RepID=UPI0023E7A28A|nr:sulfatase-like hydrolase/transferase [Halovivax sp. TS33]